MCCIEFLRGLCVTTMEVWSFPCFWKISHYLSNVESDVTTRKYPSPAQDSFEVELVLANMDFASNCEFKKHFFCSQNKPGPSLLD